MHDNNEKLTIEKANQIATGIVAVSVNPIATDHWRIEDDQLVETHKPMTRFQWHRFLADWIDKSGNKSSVVIAMNRARSDIANLADWLECELDKDSDDEITWATVGSLEHVKENLIETLAYFSGVEKDEITRNLDELHM